MLLLLSCRNVDALAEQNMEALRAEMALDSAFAAAAEAEAAAVHAVHAESAGLAPVDMVDAPEASDHSVSLAPMSGRQ